MTADNLKNWVMGFIFIGAIALFAQLLSAKDVTSDERSRVTAFIPLWIANAVFWALYQQQFTVMAVYSDERLNWNILGMELSPNLVNSINPIFIIVFGMMFSALWTKWGDRQPGHHPEVLRSADHYWSGVLDLPRSGGRSERERRLDRADSVRLHHR